MRCRNKKKLVIFGPVSKSLILLPSLLLLRVRVIEGEVRECVCVCEKEREREWEREKALLAIENVSENKGTTINRISRYFFFLQFVGRIHFSLKKWFWTTSLTLSLFPISSFLTLSLSHPNTHVCTHPHTHAYAQTHTHAPSHRTISNLAFLKATLLLFSTRWMIFEELETKHFLKFFPAINYLGAFEGCWHLRRKRRRKNTPKEPPPIKIFDKNFRQKNFALKCDFLILIKF